LENVRPRAAGGFNRPLTLAAAMAIGADGIHVDYAGTSPASAFGERRVNRVA
jgi:hypothetical protein